MDQVSPSENMFSLSRKIGKVCNSQGFDIFHSMLDKNILFMAHVEKKYLYFFKYNM